eukprot:12517516-Alexandrium_andersonii.AAC.1
MTSRNITITLEVPDLSVMGPLQHGCCYWPGPCSSVPQCIGGPKARGAPADEPAEIAASALHSKVLEISPG